MNNINKLEKMAAEWYSKAPHLPKNGQKWLATNAWWIVLVGVILGAVGIYLVLVATFFAGALLTGVAGVAGAAIAGIALIAVVVAMLISLMTIVLSAMAISPLKAMQKKGWTLIFITVLIEIAAQVIQFLFDYNLFGLVWNLLFAAVGAYFLFEVRSYFGETKKITEKKSQA
jgi:hypothetical protein